MKNNRTLPLLIDAILLVSVAVLYTWSVFAAPLETAYGYSHVQTSAVFTISICSYCGGALLAGMLAKRLRMPHILLIAAVFLSGGFALCGLSGALWGLLAGYGLLGGAGVGMVYNTVLCDCARRFPDKPGLSSGVLLMAYSFGALLISHVSARLLASVAIESVFLLFAGFELIALVAGAFFSHLLAAPSEAKASAVQNGACHFCAGYRPREMLCMRSFYRVFFWLMIMSASALTIIDSAAHMAQAAGFAPQTATLLTGLISFVGAFGRLGFGRIFDKSGHLTAVRTDGCLIAGSAAFMLIAFSYHSPILFAVGLLLLGFCFGGMSSICAALAGRLYGLRFYAQNLSIISLQMIPASLLGPMISGAIYDRTGSYTLVFVVVLILSLLTNLIGYHIDR